MFAAPSKRLKVDTNTIAPSMTETEQEVKEEKTKDEISSNTDAKTDQ